MHLWGVSFTDGNNGFAVGNHFSNIILRTTDGGENWINQSDSLFLGLLDVSFVDANNGFAVGIGGEILRTTNGGITFLEGELYEKRHSDFILHDNYPNPFNPRTMIRFTIPQNERRKRQNVKLEVFDVLGSEVAILVNEDKPTGSYEVTFDASALPSGVYFYQLRTGSYVETKKMVLLR